eukprot:6179328-Pleurochrysis_carterae.AAC.2
MLESFDTVWQRLSPRADEGAASTLPLSLRPPPAADALLEQLSDPDSQLRTKLPVLGRLSRRFGATLLRRVAQRLEADGAAPAVRPLAKSVSRGLVQPARSAAKLIEPQLRSAEQSQTDAAALSTTR